MIQKFTTHKRLAGLSAGALALVSVLSACGSDDANDSVSGGDTVRVWSTQVAGTLPIWVAQREGFFDEVGLSVDLTLGTDLVTATQGLGSQYDIALGTTAAAFPALEQGFPLKVIAGDVFIGYDNPGCAMLVTKDGADSFADLEGKKVGVPTLTGLFAQTAQYMVAADGGDPDAVQWVQVNYPMVDQLAAGRVDALIATTPVNVLAAHEGFQVGDDACTEAVADATGDDDPRVPAGFWQANESFVNDQPGAVAKWVKAMDLANAWIVKNEGAAKDVLVEETGLDPELAADMTLYEYSSDIAPEDFAGLIEVALRVGAIGAELKPDAFVAP